MNNDAMNLYQKFVQKKLIDLKKLKLYNKNNAVDLFTHFKNK